MTAFRPTTAAGAAILGLLAGCDQPAPATAVGAQPPVAAASAVATEDTLVAVENAPRKRGGGAFGVGIRPTGSTANGITP